MRCRDPWYKPIYPDWSSDEPPMTAAHGFTVATSIPPKVVRWNGGRDIGAEYQRLCVQSWIDCGFRVISVNNPDEIEPLAGRYPEITFVSVPRNASALAGRKTPFIADLLQALLATSEANLGIINADLVFEPTKLWQERLPDLIANTVIGAHRFDIAPLFGGAPRRYRSGLDCFLFERGTAVRLAEKAGQFAMGLPWWDCWLPAAATLIGCDFRMLDRPGIAHLLHPQGYRDGTLRQFSREFATFVVNEADARPDREFTGLSAIVPGCRSLINLYEQQDVALEEERKVAEELAKSMERWYEMLSQRPLRFKMGVALPSAARAAQLTPSAIFEHFDERVSAGDALRRSLYLEQQGDFDGARRLLEAALERCPDDFEVLAGFGEYHYRRGDAGNALALLQRAAKQQSHSGRMLNSMGVVLTALGRRDEAIICFKRIVQAGADFRDAHCNLAVVLHEARRVKEAIECLDAAILRWPEDDELKQLRWSFSSSERTAHPAQASATRPNPR